MLTASQTALNVVVGFVVVFVTPYLLRSIGSGTAYIWGGFAILSSIWAFFFMPELKGRNLEEIDQLFEANISARKFSDYETGGLTHELALRDNGQTDGKVLDDGEGDVEAAHHEATAAAAAPNAATKQ